MIVLERIRDDVAETRVLAVGSARIGSRDGVVLRLPVGVEGDVGEVQEVGFEEVGVEGPVDGVAALAVGAGVGREQQGEESECQDGGHGLRGIGACAGMTWMISGLYCTRRRRRDVSVVQWHVQGVKPCFPKVE